MSGIISKNSLKTKDDDVQKFFNDIIKDFKKNTSSDGLNFQNFCILSKDSGKKHGIFHKKIRKNKDKFGINKVVETYECISPVKFMEDFDIAINQKQGVVEITKMKGKGKRRRKILMKNVYIDVNPLEISGSQPHLLYDVDSGDKTIILHVSGERKGEMRPPAFDIKVKLGKNLNNIEGHYEGNYLKLVKEVSKSGKKRINQNFILEFDKKDVAEKWKKIEDIIGNNNSEFEDLMQKYNVKRSGNIFIQR